MYLLIMINCQTHLANTIIIPDIKEKQQNLQVRDKKIECDV